MVFQRPETALYTLPLIRLIRLFQIIYNHKLSRTHSIHLTWVSSGPILRMLSATSP